VPNLAQNKRSNTKAPISGASKSLMLVFSLIIF
jgi:hypothetical protein